MGNPLGLSWTINRIRHAFLKPNSKAGSKKNIHAHYDLGNAFYGEQVAGPHHDLLLGASL